MSSFKLLGVWISNDLSWNTHVDMVLKKANSRLYALRLLKKAGLQASHIVQIYISFISSGGARSQNLGGHLRGKLIFGGGKI